MLEIVADDGRTGLAECNHTPTAVKAFLDARSTSAQTRNIRELLIGRELSHPTQIRAELLSHTQSAARRGIGLALINAIDSALWDLWSQTLGEPLWRCLWGDTALDPLVYATVYTGPGDYQDSLERLRGLVEACLHAGYRAIKVEPLADCVPPEMIAGYVAYARRLVGDDIELLVDVYHRFESVSAARDAIMALEPSRPHLVETPLSSDDIEGYAELSRSVKVPIAASELFESAAEFETLLRYGDLPVAQPWPNRMGVSGTLEVISHCRRLGRRCVIAGWNATSIGVALGVHLAAGLDDGITLEHAPADVYGGFGLREIAQPEPDLSPEGRLVRPIAPGIGVDLDAEGLAALAEGVG